MWNRSPTPNKNVTSKTLTNSNKIGKLINEFTEITRPPGKSNSRVSTPPSNTFPRSKSTQPASNVDKKLQLNRSISYNKYRNTPDNAFLQEIEEQVEEYGKKLRRKMREINTTGNDEFIATQITTNVSEKIEEPTVSTNNIHEEKEEEEEDIFGFNNFDENCDDNYIVETFNEDGKYLIISTLQITRKTIQLNEEEKLEDLIHDSDVVIVQNADQVKDCDKTFKEIEVSDNNEQTRNCKVECLKNCDLDINGNDSDREHGDNFYHISFRNSDFTLPNILNRTKSVIHKEKINYIIEEIIKTEEYYIKGLQTVVKKYIPYVDMHVPQRLIGQQSYLFGNIKGIYENAKIFLQLLKKNSKDADQIANAFIISASSFDLYIQYSKNKPTADMYLKEFDEIVKVQQMNLGDKLGLASYLLTPIQRLGKYILMLESIQKELNKLGKPSEKIHDAINVIRKVMRKGNDYIAIDSIKKCPIDLSMQGSFIMRTNFNILKPKKYLAMVFLFENMIVITQKVSKNLEQFDYIDSIEMSELSLGKFEEKPTIFHLADYRKLKKSHRDEVTYVLEAETPKIKNEWTMAIGDKLWNQLEKAKELQAKLNSEEGKRLSKVSLPGSLSSKAPPKARKSRKSRSKSTFYE